MAVWWYNRPLGSMAEGLAQRFGATGLLRPFFVAVYVLVLLEAGMALGTDAPVSDLHVVELCRCLRRIGLHANGVRL